MESQQGPLMPSTTTTVTTAGDEIATKEPSVPKSVPKECNEDDNDDNESWFELELTFPKPPDSSKCTTNPPRNHAVFCKTDTDSDLGCSKRRASTTSTSSDDSTVSATSFYRDHHHIRRMESPDVRFSTENSPRSPISILRTPTLRGLMFRGENRSVREEKAETYSNFAVATPSRSWSRRGVRFFSVKFRIEDVSKFRPSNSSRINRSSTSRVSIPERRSVDDGEASSRRLSKYLNFLRPLYLKVSEKDKLKEEFGVGVPSAAGIGSPARRGWMWSPMRATTKEREERRGGSRFGGNAMKLSKSRSASLSSAIVGVGFSPASTKDDSMKQQKDGIEGAILHCKQSLNSSSERSCALARCTSDSASNGKSLQRL